jgi:hypothetical protein
MTYSHLNRRAHLYLGLFLTPWVLMYGFSSIPFAHHDYFEQRDKALGLPMWTKTYEGVYDLGPIPSAGSLRPLAAKVARDFQLQNESYGAYRPNPQQVVIYIHTFWKATQFRYFVEEKRIVREARRFRWEHFFTAMHARGGFEDRRFLSVAWSVLVDLVCLGFLLWIVSGLYMWWSLPGLRNWGWIAVAGGLLSFTLFIWRL